jgi:prolyl-tRNA synthetase
MYEAYQRIFTRCGLEFRAVEADSGAIGGDVSHEFMVLAPSGEAVILYCEACSYAANDEKATTALPEALTEALLPLEEVATPGQTTISAVTAFLQVSPEQLIKTLFYVTDDEYIAVLIRGDDELNEIKLGNLINKPFRLAPPEELAAELELPVGYVGPIGLREKKVKVLADLRIKMMTNAVCGANRKDYHLCNVNPERDFAVDTFVDLRLAKAGDPCSHCGHPLAETRGVEVGHIFKLGTKYSNALEATFRDEDGKEKPFIMGCYGIGVSRIVAAAIEQNNDQDGIKWPLPIAPFQVTILALGTEQKAAAEEIYQELSTAGVEVLFDDRDERPGVKFKDADLIGIPLRLTVGPKGLAQGEVEVKVRATGEDFRWPLPEVTTRVLDYLKNSFK